MIQVKLPIRKHLLNTLILQINTHFRKKNQFYLMYLYRAIFMSSYYRMLRIGEVTSGTHPKLAKDVQSATNKRKILFILRTSKTHWCDKMPQMVRISAAGRISKIKSPLLCPYEALRNYVKLRGPCRRLKEPFFVFKDHSAVTPNHVRMVLHTILTEAGLAANMYSFQGMRAGRATDLMRMGVSVESIKKLGHWKSNAVYTYLR